MSAILRGLDALNASERIGFGAKALTNASPCAKRASGAWLRRPAASLLLVAAVSGFGASHAACQLDVDGNGATDVMTDAALIYRNMQGQSGPALTQGLLPTIPVPTRDAAQIAMFISQHRYDVDGNGQVDAATDGVLILRYLLGFRGDALIANAIGVNADGSAPPRNTAAAVLDFFAGNACQLLPAGVQSMVVSYESDDTIYLLPTEIRTVTPRLTLASGVSLNQISMSIPVGAQHAVATQAADQTWSITVTAAAIAAGGQTSVVLRITNSATGASVDYPLTIKVLAPTQTANGNVTSAGGTVPLGTAAIEFSSNSLAAPATATVNTAATAQGNTVVTVQFNQDVSTTGVQMKLPRIASTATGPALGGGSMSVASGGAAKSLTVAATATSALTLAVPYSSDSNSLGYEWRTFPGYAFETNGEYRVPSETAIAVIDAQTVTKPTANSTLAVPVGHFELETGLRLKQVPVAKLYSVAPAQPYIGPVDPAVTAQYAPYEPMVFVHGFTPSIFGLGGGSSTWGQLPKLAMDAAALNGRKLVPFEFRWLTNAHFIDAAADLAEAILYIQRITGKRVHIVAHSFGGVLVRSLLQGQVRGLPTGSTTAADARAAVASVITLGAPHSGIADSATTVAGVVLPAGQDSALFEGCGQVSCHVMGEPTLNLSSSGTLNDALRRVLGVSATAGELAAQLANTASQLPAVPIRVGIGLSTTTANPSAPIYTYRNGDNLISYLGQRFLPGDSTATPLRTAASVGAATVTETVLGSVRQAVPGTVLNAAETTDLHLLGYRHNDSVPSGAVYWSGLEVAAGCTVASTCNHAGYLLLKSAFALSSFKLNDTGITFSGAASSGNSASCLATNPAGQDCRYGRDAAALAGTLNKVGGSGGVNGFDFTKISNSGADLPASAALGSGANDWACTRDNVTGLIWEVKTTSGLRSMNHIYTWYMTGSPDGNNGTPAATTGTATCATLGRCDTEKFVADVNSVASNPVALCGYRDWRMPTVTELHGIVDFGRANLAIDPTYFPYTSTEAVWSGSPHAYHPGFAWIVWFDDSVASLSSRSNTNSVRLVRGGQ